VVVVDAVKIENKKEKFFWLIAVLYQYILLEQRNNLLNQN